MYEAKFENDKLVMTPPEDPHFKHLVQKEIALSEVADKIGFIEAGDLDDKGDAGFLDLHLKGQEHSDFVVGLSLQEIRVNASALVEIDSIGALLPLELLTDGPRDESEARIDAFLQQIFNDVATGKKNSDGYLTSAFINPAAVESIEDEGDYRSVNIKPAFGGKISVVSPLSATELNKRLGFKGP